MHGKVIKHVSNRSGPEDPQTQISKHPNALQVLRGLRMHHCFEVVCVCVRENLDSTNILEGNLRKVTETQTFFEF